MDTIKGSFFDGEFSRRHPVDVAFDQSGTHLKISGETNAIRLSWPLVKLRGQKDRKDGDPLILSQHQEVGDETQRSLARLAIEDDQFIAMLESRCASLFKTDVRSGAYQRLLVRASAAIAAIVLMLFVVLPSMANTLARIIPIEREVAFGKTIVAQVERFLGAKTIGDLRCSAPKGIDALDRLTARLTANFDLEYRLEFSVFDSGMVNAFAAPGGQIVLTRGLLETATGPDAVAAVLAHEIGHVERRDATRNSLRSAGSAGILALVLGDVAGGSVMAILADNLLHSNYSRAIETKADTFALSMLNSADISSMGMASFFDQLEKAEGPVTQYMPAYLLSHPSTGTRADRARNNASKRPDGGVSLGADDWFALQMICS